MGNGPIINKKGPIVFYCSDGSKECMDQAKEYIKRFNLTMDDVSLKQNTTETVIRAKRDIRDKLK